MRLLRRNSKPVYGPAFSPGAGGVIVATGIFPQRDFPGPVAYHRLCPRLQKLIHSPTRTVSLSALAAVGGVGAGEKPARLETLPRRGYRFNKADKN